MEEILLPVLDRSRRRAFDEVIPAEALGGRRYRLVASPGMVEGLAAGDEIELVPDETAGFRLLARGGNLCVWIYLPEAEPCDADERLIRAATALGGYLDGGQQRLRVLTIPVATGVARIERELDAAVKEIDGAERAYGNAVATSE